MADDQWLLKEDGYLNIDTETTNIVYHSNLNVILVFTKHDELKVLDINSGVILQSCSLSGSCSIVVAHCVMCRNSMKIHEMCAIN